MLCSCSTRLVSAAIARESSKRCDSPTLSYAIDPSTRRILGKLCIGFAYQLADPLAEFAVTLTENRADRSDCGLRGLDIDLEIP